MPDSIDQIVELHDAAAWRRVPYDVAELVVQLVEPAFKFAAAAIAQDDYMRCYWNPITDRFARGSPPSADYILYKAAAEDFLRPVAEGLKTLQKPIGGPNPLTSAIVGGVLGSGLGYGGGYLAEKMLGDRVEPGRLRRSMALMGGALGTIPGAISYGVNRANPQATGGGLQSALSRWPAEPGFDEPSGGDPHLSSLVPPVTKTSRFDSYIFFDPDVEKCANVQDAGAFYFPSIPVDAFNNAVWSDVRPVNPYGTKSPWGSNDQPLGTPAPSAATISGLVAGAAAATGQDYVSPYHIALTAGMAGAKGYAAGLFAGKALGALAGVSPEVQETLKQTGLWSGIISGVANAIFGDA